MVLIGNLAEISESSTPQFQSHQALLLCKNKHVTIKGSIPSFHFGCCFFFSLVLKRGLKHKFAELAGYFYHTAKLQKNGSYRTIKNPQTVSIHPSSGLSQVGLLLH